MTEWSDLPQLPEAAVISQDESVVEGELGRFQGIESLRILGVVTGFGASVGFGYVYGGDGMAAGVAIGIGVISEQGLELHLETRLLLRFPHRRMFQGLAHIHEAAGDGPTVGRILALDEYDGTARLVQQLDDDVGGDDGRDRRSEEHTSELQSP